MKNLLKINLFLFNYSSKKLIFVFILLLLLTFTGCKSVVKDTVVEPVVKDTVVEPVVKDTVVEPAVVAEKKQIIEVSETVQNLIRSKNVTVIYNPNPKEPFLNPKNEADFLLLQTPMITFQKAFTDKGFNVLDPTAFKEVNKDVHYVTTFLAQVRIVKGTEISEARALIQASLREVGTKRLITTVERKGRKKFPKTDSGLDLMQNLQAALKQSAEQIAPKLTNSLIEILYEHAESGSPFTVQLFAGKSRHITQFMRMLKKIKGVTNVKTMARAGKKSKMRINYKGTAIVDLLMALEDAFYSNRKFKGYALDSDQMGDVLRLKMVESP